MRVYDAVTLLYEIDAQCIPHDDYTTLLDIAFKEVSGRQDDERWLFFEPEIGRTSEGELSAFSFTVLNDDESFEDLLTRLEQLGLCSRELSYILMSLRHRAMNHVQSVERGAKLAFDPDSFIVRMEPSTSSSHGLPLLWKHWDNHG